MKQHPMVKAYVKDGSYILRQFKTMPNNLDYQYVSMVNAKGHPIGYDKKQQYRLRLSKWQSARVKAYLNSIGAIYQVVQA